MSKHSQTPWQLDDDNVRAIPGGLVASCHDGIDDTAYRAPIAHANAALIVRAVNAHEAMTALAQSVVEFKQYCADYAVMGGGEMHDKYGDDPSDGFLNVEGRARALAKEAIAALALAKGETP